MLNPITYTERVVSDFLRYQLTTYAFADHPLYTQMRRLLNLEETRATPLLRGPFISLSQSFREGRELKDLASEGLIHPHLANIALHGSLYGHQEDAVRAIMAGQTTLVATGTGSGKTECFLYPIISRCLELRDQGAPEGIAAVIVYPMNALAEDQLGRLRELLVGTGISFGMYVGKTPERAEDVSGVRLAQGASRADYREQVARLQRQKLTMAVHPPEERVSRVEMRTPGKQPRILLTNVKQLELLLTRHQDVELFDNATLHYLVFDEAHTFRGAMGAETACLIRRLRSFCGRSTADTVCIATSATIADPAGGKEAGSEFAARFFGVDAGNVALISEQYAPDLWAAKRTVSAPLPGDPVVQLNNVLAALSSGEAGALRAAYQGMTGAKLDLARLDEHLYERLAANEVVYQVAEALARPRALPELVADLRKRLGRDVPEEEILAWLALGASSRKNGRPLLRPVVHGFVRGVGGAVVTFPEGFAGTRLWLSAEDAAAAPGDRLFPLPITACTTCGQHYFVHHAADFEFTGPTPGGGEASGNRVIWRPQEASLGGRRLVLLDRLVVNENDDLNQVQAPRNSTAIYYCRFCGTLHREDGAPCLGCGRDVALVPLWVVQQRQNHPGYLVSCVGCSAIGGQNVGNYREPARPVRALTVSDVHVLAQSMIQHAERRRLLVFADNRQDAAFQAGWMQDHARRYRLRSLMYEKLMEGPVRAGDLIGHLDHLLDADDDFSRALLPEVWRVGRKEAEPAQHAGARRKFLRIQVLRELATGPRQRIGLEPWGRMVVDYDGLTPDLPFVGEWAGRIGSSEQQMCEGVAALLDMTRRNRLLLDREHRLFHKYWKEGDWEIQRGFLPLQPGGPRGLKLHRNPTDNEGCVKQWYSLGRLNTFMHAVRQWGLQPPADLEFFRQLWALLTDELLLLAPVILTSQWGRALPNGGGVYQVDADRLVLRASRGVYVCATCRKPHPRPTPGLRCTEWRCLGQLNLRQEDPDNYNLLALDQKFAMLRPREHSAQVPAEDREMIERSFKSDNERLNTLVCTPTLELGVDIGALDAVLMRNVPPLPANYWQRAGRAGRRHRMAVNLTYARSASHDRSYFQDPLRLLDGLIAPPSFNLANAHMVRKHVHATVLTALHAMARDGSNLPASDRSHVREILQTCFPGQIRHYLFDAAGSLRTEPFDLSPLETVLSRHEGRILQKVRDAFLQGWPAEDASLVAEDRLRQLIRQMRAELAAVIIRLDRRLRWAEQQMDRLDTLRRQKGTLDPEEDSLRMRCDRLVKRLKGISTRRRRETEGFDDSNTYGVLAAEGFLPGYGLDTGWVVGYHQAPLHGTDLRDWELRRGPALALREYVPGNLVYANGHRFVPRFYHLEPVAPTLFQVDLTSDAVVEAGGALQANLGAAALPSIPICDVDLPHNSQISDDEDYRFQLSVAVFGYEQARHGEGQSFTWGARIVSMRRSVHFRLVNVGAANLVRGTGQLGYPVCLVCGQSRSPLASQADLQQFQQDHANRCGRPLQNVGFHADIVADAINIRGCASREEAFSIAEALRMGATQILEMEMEDLQILALGNAGQTVTDIAIYDPMPGGSGLLDQMIARWSEIVEAARQLLNDCPGQCGRACVDCLMTFRNSFYHRHLNRHWALTCLQEWGPVLMFSNSIPDRLPGGAPHDQPVNAAEDTLRAMLDRAGFSGYSPQHPIDLGPPSTRTCPDFFFEDPTGRVEGICIYLDGMSAHLHGNPETRQRDRAIREELRARDYEVFEIPFGDLTDKDAMRQHFYRLGRRLVSREKAAHLRDEPNWFEGPAVVSAPATGWDEILDLLDTKWQPLALGLRDAGLTAPMDVDFDIVEAGRVTGRRAVMIWGQGSAVVGLVEQGVVAGSNGWIEVTPETAASDCIDGLRRLIGGAA
jgi:ATP-dependent helicase YprA (DUF1998 family)